VLALPAQPARPVVSASLVMFRVESFSGLTPYLGRDLFFPSFRSSGRSYDARTGASAHAFEKRSRQPVRPEHPEGRSRPDHSRKGVTTLVDTIGMRSAASNMTYKPNTGGDPVRQDGTSQESSLPRGPQGHCRLVRQWGAREILAGCAPPACLLFSCRRHHQPDS